MWLVIIIALILLLKTAMTSHKASVISTGTVYVSACGSSGDSFNTGCTTVAGVPEPIVDLMPTSAIKHCNVIAHFPVNPPPIAIQTVRPIFTPHCNIAPVIPPWRSVPSGGGGSNFRTSGLTANRYYTL